MTDSSFAKLGVAEQFVTTLTNLHITEPTPVQHEAIPFVLEGRDVLAAAQTGTGKTIAFGLPILQKLSEQPSKPVNPQTPCEIRALVLVPTRELAQQVFTAITQYGESTELKVGVVYGGTSFGVQAEMLTKAVMY
ncbi:ATP-dependent RNA helicase [Vibrio ishigakensis]|uniref:ATP-dependent RNA helicase n=1 Tax=Vibrio ishigakensis TaxID=1481914 RepID=A0A0B8QGC0_9VIBR|nr:ATP-dependent RNA helicase [Vibrio ishigakensis]